MRGSRMENLYAVEYSIEQGCWNIATIDDILKSNIRMLQRKVSNDYKMVYLGTYDECTMFIRNYEDVWGEINE